jgi:myo-inositol catabolism protein IolC
LDSTETYVSYFSACKDLQVLLLGLDPFIPEIAGSDRARTIVNALLLVWPGTHNVLCWPHVYLYIKGSKFAKHMSSACTAELRERIEGEIISFHEACNQVEFDYVFVTMRVVLTKKGKAGFAAYFKRHYATGVGARWWYGASITPGVKANQNSVESEHSVQKKLLGAAS